MIACAPEGRMIACMSQKLAADALIVSARAKLHRGDIFDVDSILLDALQVMEPSGGGDGVQFWWVGKLVAAAM